MKKICISRDWLLSAPGTDGYQPVDLPNDYTVTLPRDKHVPGGGSNGYFPGGIGTYVKALDIGEKAGHYILDIDGAYMCTQVDLNGSEVIMHPHGYTPMLIDLTGRLHDGENTLVITTNGLQRSTRWYAGAGIYRDVFLWKGGDVRIEPWDLFITTPTLDTVNAAYDIASDRDADILLKTEILDADGQTVAAKETAVSVKAGTKTKARVSFTLIDAHIWDMETPYLYTMRSTVTEGDTVLDEDLSRFGIRTVTADAEHGLRLNGKTVKLRGGCIHHDHGVLGAADWPAACKRKLTLLKAVGFNALRIAHNPPSEQLMELCDEMGIIVMDEAFDCWRWSKCGPLGYNNWFDAWWERDISYMVLRDRRHPSVIAFSTGNEIPESVGSPEGDELSARLAAKIRSLDPTRLVTSCTYQMGDGATWADRTAAYFAPYDICGYNYLYNRYAEDHKQFPRRVIWGSETHALNFYDSWQTVLANPYVIGDFTWTAYDNLGESGTGRALWARDGIVPGINIAPYPYRTCYQGDLDLCGYRRPQSYFREAVWIGGTEPRIFTTHPEHYGEGFTGTGWHWYDVLDSWTFDDAYTGKPVKCEVYTDADEIAWFVNGKPMGKSVPQKAIATMDIPYEKGTLSVIAYRDGAVCGTSVLHTVGAAAKLAVTAETEALAADNRDLCYFDITVTDENGDRVPDAKCEISCFVDGGSPLGIFSGDPNNEDQYGSDTCHTFEGRAVAIVRTDRPGEVRITVTSKALSAGSTSVIAE